MLWTIVAILVALWLIGFIGSHAIGGLIHLLLVAAVAVFVYNLAVNRRSARL